MKIAYTLLLASLCSSVSFSQDIRFAELNATPLQVNPANTGAFNGNVRASTMYGNHWASVTVPYVTYGSSLDLPVYTTQSGNSIAAGLYLMNDAAGDAALQNAQGLLSVAYHMHFASKKDSNFSHRSVLSIGAQGGYNNRVLDMTDLYFNQPAPPYYPNPNTPLGIGNSVNYYSLNAGISFTHDASKDLNYTIGFSGNNLVQPSDPVLKANNSITGLAVRFIGNAGVCWTPTKRLSIMPRAFLQINEGSVNKVAGSEFDYAINKNPVDNGRTTFLFGGVWYNFNNQFIHTAGISFKGFRLGMGYFYQYTSAATNGEGGYELTLCYIARKNRPVMHK